MQTVGPIKIAAVDGVQIRLSKITGVWLSHSCAYLKLSLVIII